MNIAVDQTHPALTDARQALGEFLDGTAATLALVVDPAGRVVLAAGNPGAVDPTSFASVCAAHFEANLQLASLVGEPEFKTLLHQGTLSSVHLASVGRLALLAVIYEGTQLLEDVGSRGSELAGRLHEPVRDILAGGGADSKGLGSDWVDAVENEIERLFKEGV